MATSIPPKDDNEQGSAAAEASAKPTGALAALEYTLLVQRQDALEKPASRRIDELRVSCSPSTSVLGALKLDRNRAAGSTEQTGGSIAWEGDCFEGSCGGCSMLSMRQLR